MTTTESKGRAKLADARYTCNKLVSKLGGMVDILDAMEDAEFPIRPGAFGVLVDATRAAMEDAETAYEALNAVIKTEA